MRLKQTTVVLFLVVLAAVAYGQIRGSASSGTAPYRVTSRPDHEPDGRYVEEMEKHLNQMAGDGWRFHSELDAPGIKMMVFERAGR